MSSRTRLACFACATLFGASAAFAGQVTQGPIATNPPQNSDVPDTVNYIHDDGTVDTAVGITDPQGPQGQTHDILWINRFAVQAGGEVITHIRAAFGSPADTRDYNGIPVTLLLYNDADAGSPTNATLLTSFGTTITNGNTGIINTYDIPDTLVTGNFWVGVVAKNVLTGTNAFPQDARFLASLDTTDPDIAGVSWAGFTEPGNTLNENNLATIPAGQLNTIEAFGLPGNWVVRAIGEVPEPASLGLLAVGGLFLMRRRG